MSPFLFISLIINDTIYQIKISKYKILKRGVIKIFTMILAAIGGMIFANIVTYGEERRYEQKRRQREKRKKLGKKWYDD